MKTYNTETAVLYYEMNAKELNTTLHNNWKWL